MSGKMLYSMFATALAAMEQSDVVAWHGLTKEQQRVWGLVADQIRAIYE